MKRFNVVLPKDDGGLEVHPMKAWLRQHPEHVPSGLDATGSTSHQLRNGLKKQGWQVQERESETVLLPPGGEEWGESIDSVLGTEDETEEREVEVTEAAFALEYQLRDFIAQNIESIPLDGQQLHLFVDAGGRDGIEYPTDVGPIDILAVDDAEDFIVFELKRAGSPDRAIGQLTRYMGWVTQTIGRGRQVRGVIVAKTINKKLRYAASVVPGVALMEYAVEFHLRAADDLPSRSDAP